MERRARAAPWSSVAGLTGLVARAALVAAAAAGALCAGCTGDAEVLDPADSYHVTGGFLRDPQGRALLLRGVNLSGEQKVAPYLDFHTLPDWQRVSDPWGMNAARFVMTWAAVEPSEGVFDESYLDEVALRMDWAR
jgi:hypothetical protein